MEDLILKFLYVVMFEGMIHVVIHNIPCYYVENIYTKLYILH